MAKFIRIETAAGGGLYGAALGFYEVCGDHFSASAHPMPADDTCLVMACIERLGQGDGWPGFKRWFWDNTDNLRFGFADDAQARRWLYNYDWIRQLNEGSSLRVSDYEIPDEYLFIGGAQAMFNKDHAVLIGTRSLLTLIGE